jgi:biotin carboxyl carrier protein
VRYFATVPDAAKPRELDVRPLSGTSFAVTMDGQRHQLDLVPIDGHSVSILVDGESYAVEFDASGDVIQVLVRGAVVSVDLADERKMRLRSASGLAGASGPQIILAPMPGKVVKLLAKVGEDVVAGQGLVVVEAMKMENELKSARAGRVIEIAAAEGQPVERGARLIVVE